MLKKLRVKFVVINMALVSAVLVAVFGAVCFMNYQRMQSQRRDALFMELEPKRGEQARQYRLLPPNEQPFEGRRSDKAQDFRTFMPSFVVELDENGSITFMRERSVQVEEDIRDMAVSQALKQESDMGTLRQLGLCYLRLSDSDGTRIAFIDITEQKREFSNLVLTFAVALAAALAVFLGISMALARWSLIPVERAWEQQQRFIADASHELKTPLTVILANIGILRSQKEDSIKNQIRWLDNTQEEGLRMKGLIDDMLFLARSDASTQKPTMTTVELSELTQSCALTFEPVAFENSVTMDYSDIEPGITLKANEEQLKRLINILIDNACKYAGENGGVAVALKKTSAVGTMSVAVLSVKNTGPVIPEKELSHIFERFYMADKSRSRAQGGYGLGLSIAESIAAAMNGRISVQSGTDGTEFRVAFESK